MIVATALANATKRLSRSTDTPRLDAELLMAHALGVSRSDMLIHHMREPTPEIFERYVYSRAIAQPVAQIIGQQEFFGITLAVTRDVLVPRSDSECVVEAALAAKPDARRVLDCGLGSGALLLALLANLPHAEGYGIERSPAALSVARKNAKAMGLQDRARMVEADWTRLDWNEGVGTFDLVIANPPYVENAADLSPDVRVFEPAEALFAGPDGLDDYRVLVPQLPPLLTKDGLAVLEIGSTQAEAVTKIAEEQGFAVEMRRDLGNRPRALILRLRLGKGESSS